MRISTLTLRTAPILGLLACVGDAPVTNADGGGPDTSLPVESGVTDSGDSSPGPDTSVWDPSQIGGLVLWLDADGMVANVNGHLDMWSDKSPKKNDAKASNESQKAVVLTPSSGINGHQALRFDGVTSFYTIADNASLQWTQSFVIEAVFRHAQATASDFGDIYNKQTATALNNPSGPALAIGTSIASAGYPTIADFEISNSTDIHTDPSDGGLSLGAHRVRASWDAASTTISLQIDTQAPLQLVHSATGVDAVGHDARIGLDPNNFYLKADLAEIVAVAGATIDPGDVVKLQAYLDKKYGL